MLGPMNPEVRFVVLRLWVPVNACSVEFVSVGLPNGFQVCSVPSSQSNWRIPVRADEVRMVVPSC